ncbi:hypothetical protein [Mycoplasma marinum]|uniref:Uncharacterized protein n=1 Tax=Mycoplasma marinum TaxID=1937190 RepID=A0A4R0XU87_9MOLU|nr:hypothetical protein [Mycoplasma marinum]TCG11357.1 hypothetical protein C4B24_02285 [Mycoplasma marinum]
MKRTLSWIREEQKDCFGNVGEPTIKLIWPPVKDGAIIPENKMLLSKKSIDEIGSSTKGEVNGIRYSVTKQFVLGINTVDDLKY